MAHEDKEATGARRVTHTMTIQRSPRDVYTAWRDLESLPVFMENVVSVDEEGTRSHWIVKAPGGTVEWDAELVADVPGEVIAWRSTPDADVANSGEVRFQRAAQGRATEMRVALNWEPPGRALGAGVAKLTGDDPKRQLVKDLMRFKQLLETGGLATTRGQPRGAAQQEALEEERDDVRPTPGSGVPPVRTEEVSP
jgi:uncharacterized membrane protein